MEVNTFNFMHVLCTNYNFVHNLTQIYEVNNLFNGYLMEKDSFLYTFNSNTFRLHFLYETRIEHF